MPSGQSTAQHTRPSHCRAPLFLASAACEITFAIKGRCTAAQRLSCKSSNQITTSHCTTWCYSCCITVHPVNFSRNDLHESKCSSTFCSAVTEFPSKYIENHSRAAPAVHATPSRMTCVPLFMNNHILETHTGIVGICTSAKFETKNNLLQYSSCQPHEAFRLIFQRLINSGKVVEYHLYLFPTCDFTPDDINQKPIPFVGWDRNVAARRLAIKLKQFRYTEQSDISAGKCVRGACHHFQPF